MPADPPPVHPTARGFDAAATGYDRARPDYPDAALSLVTGRLRIGPGRHLLDLGAGTGKLTVPLLSLGAAVTAVEPAAGMRAQLARVVPAELREQLTVIDAAAESLPLSDATFDGATAAQSFHWFDGQRALAEIHRVLRPDTWFVVIHNRRDLGSPGQAAIEELVRPHRGDTPSWIDASWSRTLEQPEGFTEPQLVTIAHRQPVDADGFAARIASISFVAQLDEPVRASLLADSRDRFRELHQQGILQLDYVTEIRFLHRVAP